MSIGIFCDNMHDAMNNRNEYESLQSEFDGITSLNFVIVGLPHIYIY